MVYIESEIPAGSYVVVANHDITATGVAVLHHAAANWGDSLVARRGRQVNSSDYLNCIITNTRDYLGLMEPRDFELKSVHPAELLKLLSHDEARGRATGVVYDDKSRAADVESCEWQTATTPISKKHLLGIASNLTYGRRHLILKTYQSPGF